MSARHPVHQVILHASYFGSRAVPSSAELDGLGIPAEARREVKRACEHAAEMHDTGHQQQAWSAADAAAASIIEGLDEKLRDPGYLAPPDPLADVTNPDELAARIPR